MKIMTAISTPNPITVTATSGAPIQVSSTTLVPNLNSEMLNGKHDTDFAAVNHGNHVPTIQTASNSVFLRNDNTWQTVTPANIGAAATSHTHTKSQITDFPTLATVATSGSYTDLSNKPTIPTYSTMIGANGTTGGSSGLVPAPAAIENVEFLRGDATWQPVVTSVNGSTGAVTVSVPTKTSQLTNDSGYLTSGSFVSKTGDTMSGQLAITQSANTPGIMLGGTSAGWASGIQFNNTTATTGRRYGIYSDSSGNFAITDETAAATRIQIVSNGAVNMTGSLDVVTPNSGTTGGLRVRANATTGIAYIQFTNNAASSEYSHITSTSDGVLNFTGTLQSSGNAVWHVGNLSTTGVVVFFAMNSAPTGWLKCNGAAVSRTTYAALFAAIGTTYGAGDGSTTFNLPDLRGEFIRGWDDSRGVDSGRGIGSWQGDSIKNHVHTYSLLGLIGSNRSWPSQFQSEIGGFTSGGSFSDMANFGRTIASPATENNAGGSSVETKPRNVALLACIKY